MLRQISYRAILDRAIVQHKTLSYLPLLLLVGVLGFPAHAQSNSDDKSFDVRSSVGDLHVGKDADAGKAGLPLYPGARAKREKDNDPVNFGLLMENFGLKLIVAKYDSDDGPEKIAAFYRDKLKKYGKVLECHAHDDNMGTDINSDDDKDGDDHHATDHQTKELKCEGDNTGPVMELKAGTEDDQHVVAIKPQDEQSHSTTFVIVYVHTRGKRGEV
jgi:hypothetical protein